MAEREQAGFDEEFRQLVEKAAQRYQEQREERDLDTSERVRRSEALQQHIIARCADVEASAGEGVTYEQRRGGPEGSRDLDVHQLAWTATEPHRTLQLAVDGKVEKVYWTWTEEGLETKNYEADVADVSTDKVDELIRLLADQDAWWGKRVPGYHDEG